MKVRRSRDLAESRMKSDWGSLGWLTKAGESVPGLTVGRVTIHPGKTNPEHMHTTCDEILYLLSGRLRHTLGDEEVVLEPGDVIEIPRDTPHRAWSIGSEDADMIVIYNSGDRDFRPTDLMDSFVASPMCFPTEDLDSILARFAKLGFTRIEAFTSGPASALDVSRPAAGYREQAAEHGMSFHSIHLPVADPADSASVFTAVGAIAFAADLGAPVALYKASSIDAYISLAPQMLDRAAELGVTLVVQNHANSVLSTDDDIAAVIDGIGDPRLKVLLEVGHYEKVGVPWRKAFDRFRDQIAYCHIKDMRNRESVVYGTGEIDFSELFAEMGEIEYGNGYVVELEAAGLRDDAAAMEQGLRDSLDALRRVLS